MHKTFVVNQSAQLLDFLFDQFPDTKKTRIKQLLKHGSISVSGQVTTQYNYGLRIGDEVLIKTVGAPMTQKNTGLDFDVIYEDTDLIAISKPAGLLSVATDKIQGQTAMSIVNKFVREKSGRRGRTTRHEKSAYIVHRIDRDVSGVMLFAKNEKTKRALQLSWAGFNKKYLAVVEGKPDKESDIIVSYLSENKIFEVISGPERLGAREARTYYEVLRTGTNYSLLSLKLGTGRKHQIRVHLADIGCPIAGDKTYGAKTNPIKRIALHACSLEFFHPITKNPLIISCPAPDSFKKCL